MTKIIGIANSCKDCPERHYYSGGAYECLKVRGSRLNADSSIPAWCPLPDHPADAIESLQRDNAALMEDAAAQVQIARDAVERAALFRALLDDMAKEFVRVFPIYYYAEPWAHDQNAALRAARVALAQKEG